MSRKWMFVRGGVAIILILSSLYWGSKVLSFADTMSIKYQESGLNKSQIDKINKREVPDLYVTGWNQTKDKNVENKEMGKQVSVTKIEVYGDMTTVIPSALVTGTFVQKEDVTGCIISSNAAEKLFGNRMVSGCSVSVDNGEYIVRGVLDSKEAILLISSQEGTFSNLEFRYGDSKYPASNTKADLGVLGLPAYGCFTEGNLYAGVARLFMGFPFLWMGLLFTKRLYIQRKKERKIVLYIIIGSVCVLVFIKYSMVFSEDYIPSRVSDFGFWTNKLKEVRTDYLQLLHYQMWYKEQLLLDNLRRCFISVVASCFLIKFCFHK